MRVLITNHDLNDRAGSQRWVGTMANEFARRGDDVRLLSVTGNTLYPQFGPHENGRGYDLALVNHHGPLRMVRPIKMGRCVYTVHGFTPEEEWVAPGADIYAAVSELVAAHIPWSSTVIRNPVDLDEFRESQPISQRPRNALFLSNKQGAARPLIEEACRIAGLTLRVVGGETAVDNPAEVINWADVVFTIGRGVIEAMACNRNVYVMDHFGAKGYVNHGNVQRMRSDSYSGLLDSTWPDVQGLAADLLVGYDPGLRMRDYVATEHAPDVVVDRYVKLAVSTSPAQWMSGRLIRRMGGPLVSRRAGKTMSYLRLGMPGEALKELRGTRRIPPLLRAKLPAGVRLTFPEGGL